MSEDCDAAKLSLKKYIHMPPQKSLIAELLKKQTEVEQTECDSSISPNVLESSYYNIDLQDNVRLSQSMIATFSNTNDQFSVSSENTQKTTTFDSDNLTNHRCNSYERNTYQHSLRNTKMVYHDFLELSDSGSAELPTGASRNSLNSHDAFEIFAWNQKKKCENPEETNTFENSSEYCYCSNNNQPY